MDEKDLFKENCFLPCWIDGVETEKRDLSEDEVQVRQKKDLQTLLAELEEIKNNIENIKAKQWHLAKLMRFNRERFAPN